VSWPTIVKSAGVWGPTAPNLRDYAQARAQFSWARDDPATAGRASLTDANERSGGRLLRVRLPRTGHDHLRLSDA
jgi:hypothetical protein